MIAVIDRKSLAALILFTYSFIKQAFISACICPYSTLLDSEMPLWGGGGDKTSAGQVEKHNQWLSWHNQPQPAWWSLANKENRVTEVQSSFRRAVVITAGFYWGNLKPILVLRTLHVNSGA